MFRSKQNENSEKAKEHLQKKKKKKKKKNKNWSPGSKLFVKSVDPIPTVASYRVFVQGFKTRP